jgi:integrase
MTIAPTAVAHCLGWKSVFGAFAEHFAGWRACDIDYGALQAYWANRSAAPATVRWELGALRRAFHLAERDGRAECPKFPTITVSNARQGFFEEHEWRAIRAHLRAEFQDAGDMGYATGWRLMEVLTLRWAQVDFSSGLLRLEPGGTKTGAGRVYPFREYPGLAIVIERRSGLRDEF